MGIGGYSKGFTEAVNEMLPVADIELIEKDLEERKAMKEEKKNIKKKGKPKLKRVLLKLSGEALAGENKTGFSEDTVKAVADQIRRVSDTGIELAIVIGGGNFWRGRTSNDMDRVKADQIGMLATVMNCIYTADIFRMYGLRCHVMTPFLCGSMTELFDRDKAVSYMEKGDIVFFAGGTGHPYFSTDMATVLMAVEIKADTILAAKAIDGVYSADPKTDPTAVKYDRISMQEVVEKKLGVIDLAASVLAMENKMPMMLFGLSGEDSIVNALSDKFTGTIVTVE